MNIIEQLMGGCYNGRVIGTEVEVGDAKNISPPEGQHHFDLEQLQDAVGGYIQIVLVPRSKMIMAINEDGRLKGLALNPIASMIANQVIVGPACIINRDQLE